MIDSFHSAPASLFPIMRYKEPVTARIGWNGTQFMLVGRQGLHPSTDKANEP